MNFSLNGSWLEPLDPFGCPRPTLIQMAPTTAFIAARCLIVFPFAALILVLAHRSWRSSGPRSHLDVISVHVALLQLGETPGILVYMSGFHSPLLFRVGTSIAALSIMGEILFHVLNSAERHLAVVHPLVYRKLRAGDCAAVTFRNSCIGAVWLLSLGWSCASVFMPPDDVMVVFFCVCSFCFCVVTFCCLSVLRALLRPGPADLPTDRIKRRAITTMGAVTAALWLLFLGFIVCIPLGTSGRLDRSLGCSLVAGAVWFSLPSSLVMHFLYLHKNKKRTRRKSLDSVNDRDVTKNATEE